MYSTSDREVANNLFQRSGDSSSLNLIAPAQLAWIRAAR